MGRQSSLSEETLKHTQGMDRFQIIWYLTGEIERMIRLQQFYFKLKTYAEEHDQMKVWMLGMSDAMAEETILRAELESL